MPTLHALTGTFSGFDATNVDGTAIITASVSHVLDTAGNTIFVGPVIVPIGEDGTFTVSLPATNDVTLNPSGFTYTVLVKFSDGSSLESVPFALTEPTNLNSVVEAAEALSYAPGGTGVEVHSHDEYLTQAEADLLYAAIGAGGGAGTPGSKWLSGAGAPAGATGVVTDWYLNTTNYDIYEKTATSTWTSRGNLKGASGDAGAPGPANTLAIGTVTTGAAGSAAAATITGTAPNQTLNLTIPQGAAGTAGTNGQGVPTGGTAGQKLEKVDGTNYNTAWVDSVRVIVINNGAAVPVGTPAGTVIIEKNA